MILPRVLKKYETSDFGIQLRVLFFYRLCIVMAASLVLMMFYTGYIQLISPNYGKLYFPVLITEFLFLLLIHISLFLLIRGKFGFAAHLILITSFVAVWIIIFLDKGDILARFDTVVFLLAILTMLPLLVRKSLISITLYVGVNLLLLIAFLFFVNNQLNLPKGVVVDFFSDTFIALVFIGVVGYNIYKINKISQEKIISDIKEHHEAEKALLESERKYNETIDLLPQTIFQADINGRITYINKNGLETFGYSADDIKQGVTVLSMIIEEERPLAFENIKKLIAGETVINNVYTGIKKSGETFPVQIYSQPIISDNKTLGLRGIVVDITERINSEIEIKKSRDQFYSLVSNIPGVTYRCMFDSDWTMLFISGEIEQLSGYPASDFISNNIRSFDSIIYFDDRKEVFDKISKAIQLSIPWEIEYRMKHRNGSTKWVYERGRVTKDDNGKVGYLDGFILDITERKQAQVSLQESEGRIRSLIESLNEAIIVADNNHKVEYINKQFTEKLGYTPEEIVGKIGYKILHDPEDLIIVEQANKQRINNELSSYELAFKAKDGHKVDFLVSGAPLKNAEGIVVGSVGALMDITERKKVEKALKNSEEKYRTLVENINEVVMMVDNDDQILYINKRFTEKLEYTYDEVIGKIGYEFLLPENEKNKIIHANKERITKKTSQYEAIFISKDGRQIVFLVSGTPIVNNEGITIGSLGALMDITERNKAIKDLKESEERYRTLFENAQIGIYQTTPSGRILNANPAIIKMLGFDSLEELKKINLELDKDQVSRRDYFKDIIEKQGFVSNYETFWKTKSGELISIIENTQAVRDTNGKILYYDGFVENITESKAAEKALRDSQQLFETLAQNAPVGIFRTRADGYTIYVNLKWTQMSGLSFEEALGDGWIKAVHPDDRDSLKDSWDTHTSNNERSLAEYRFLKPDGTVVWVLGDAVPEIVDNKIQGYIGTLTDITERRLAEDTISRTNSQLQGVLDSATEISIIATEPSGLIVVFNKGAEKMLGYLEDEVVGKRTPEFLHLESEVKLRGGELSQLYNRKIEGYDVFVEQAKFNISDIREWTYVCKDGSHKTVSLGVTAVMNSANNIMGFLGIAIDITENKKVEKELEKHRNHLELLVKERTEELAAANEELSTTNEELHFQRKELELALNELKDAQSKLIQSEKMAALGVLSAGVAHEINNPLNFIYGGVVGLENYLKEHVKDIPEDVATLVEGIHVGVERAADIVKSLNHYSRRDDLPFIKCNIHSIIDNCLVMLQGQIKNKIDVIKNYTSKSYELLANEGKLHQAMLNILANAVQSIENNGEINIRTKIYKNNLEILVKDNGCGISKDILPKIIDPFFTTKDPGRGTGLGLSITYNILLELKGTIDFDSIPNEGTTVKIRIPFGTEISSK